MKFKLNIPNLMSTQFISTGLFESTMISLPNSPYMLSMNEFVSVIKGSYDRESLMIEHYLVSSKPGYSMTINSTSNVYVLLMLFKGKIEYADRSGESRMTLDNLETFLLFARKGTYQITFYTKDIELFTISMLESFCPIIFRNNPILHQFSVETFNRVIHSTNAKKMDTYFIRMLTRLINPPKNPRLNYDQHIIEKLNKLFSAYKGLMGKFNTNRSVQVMDNVKNKIMEQIVLMDTSRLVRLSRENGMSLSHMEVLFQEHFGLTPKKFIKQKKLEKIARLLIESQTSLIEITLEFQYSSTSSLNRAFKRQFGISMSKFRKLYHK